MAQQAPSHIITARHLERSFGSGDLETTILKDISVDVRDGEFLAIMGKSGAGKSTLLYQLSALDTPSAGTISVAGTNVLTLNETEKTAFRLNTLGYVFQNYALVPDLSARENCMLPLLMRGLTKNEAAATAEAALTAVGLADRLENLPAMLSGGEQQRVSIARATAGQPKILFADEPTANLDTTSGTQVVDLIAKLNRDSGQTVVMVTHEREYAMGCDRILHMEDGRITDEEILRS